MTFRHLILVGVVAGLLLAGFNSNALASTFTNGDFITYSQIDWASTPAAVVLLQNDYNTVFASTGGSVELGNPTRFTMVFDSPAALIAYLPDAGPIGALEANLLNPTTSSAGSFGGDVTALVLNIAFSDAGHLPGYLNVRFGDLVLTNITDLLQLNGLTVRQFSAVANTVLGGGSYGTFTPANLDPIVGGLTYSFEWGVPSIFATECLALPANTLVIQSISRTGNTIAFTWNTTANQRYQVQFKSSLTQTNWTSLGGIITATNTTMTASDSVTNAQGFYRIELLPPQRTIPTNSGFITYGQADWADYPFADALLQANYNTVFASSSGLLEAGSSNGFTMFFEDASSLLVYLPATGTPGPLDGNSEGGNVDGNSVFDPTSTSAGVFGGDVVALKLNIDFSDAGFLPGTNGVHFGDLVLVNFPPQPRGMPGLNLLTVRQFSTVVNNVLGGSTYGHYTVAYLDSIVAEINGAFLNGAASAFATNNLAVP